MPSCLGPVILFPLATTRVTIYPDLLSTFGFPQLEAKYPHRLAHCLFFWQICNSRILSHLNFIFGGGEGKYMRCVSHVDSVGTLKHNNNYGTHNAAKNARMCLLPRSLPLYKWLTHVELYLNEF